MKQLRTLFGLAICAVSLALPWAVMAQAVSWTVQGSWVDTTPAGPTYVPVYAAQCQVDGVQAWEDLALVEPSFSVGINFAETSLLECRWMQSNTYVDPPITNPSGWMPWVPGAVVQQPDDPSGSTLIIIRVTP